MATLPSLSQFVALAQHVQETMGAARAAVIYDADGNIMAVEKTVDPDEDLFELVEYVRNRIRAHYRSEPGRAAYVGLLATDQEAPSGGWGWSADAVFASLQSRMDPAGVEVVLWVETWEDELRIPNSVVDRYQYEVEELFAKGVVTD